MKKYLVLISLVVFFSCGGNKDLRPEWVKSRPIDNNHYIGIGIAQKRMGQPKNEYIEEAKKNALNDLVSAISVKISSSSILHTMDLGNSFNEDYRSKIKTTSNANVENHQMVGTYEGVNDYWVYYKINKREYQATQNRKKERATLKAKDFYNRGVKYKKEYNYKRAIGYYINSLEALKEYWGDNLQTSINGRKVFLGNEIINEINDIVGNIEIKADFENIDIKRGKKISKDILKFFVSDKLGTPLEGMPIFFYYSGRPISNYKKVYTNSQGVVSYDLGKIKSKKSKEYFQANLNLVAIVRNATKDPMISKLVAKISTPQGKVDINVETPNVYIESVEKNMGKVIDNTLISILENTIIKKNLSIVENKSNADFIIKINTDTKKGEYFKSTGLYSVNFIGNFKVFNNKGKNVYTYRLTKIKGVGNSYEDAGEKCYKNAKREVKYKVSNQVYRNVFE